MDTFEEITARISDINIDVKDIHNMLLEACSNGNITIIKALHEHEFEHIPKFWEDVLGPLKFGYFNVNITLINIASCCGYLEIVKYLISKNYNYQYVLTFAALGNWMDIVNFIFDYDKNLDINQKFPSDNFLTPLNIACYLGNIDIVDKLLYSGATVDDYSIFLAANYIDFYEIVEIDDDDDDYEKCPKDDDIVLHMLKALVTQGAKVSISDILIPKNFDSKSFFRNLVYDRLYKCLEFTVSMGCDLSKIYHKHSGNLLHTISSGQNLKIIQLLIDNKVDVNAFCTKCKYTPLHLYYNRTFSSYKIIEMLIKKGANVNSQTIYGDTPLHTACTHLKYYNFGKNINKYFIILVENGAKIDILNNIGQTPLGILLENNEYPYIQELINYLKNP